MATNCDQRVIRRSSPPQWLALASLVKTCLGTSFRSWANTVSEWRKARVPSMTRAFLAKTPLPLFATPSLATYRFRIPMGQQWVRPAGARRVRPLELPARGEVAATATVAVGGPAAAAGGIAPFPAPGA